VVVIYRQIAQQITVRGGGVEVFRQTALLPLQTTARTKGAIYNTYTTIHIRKYITLV